MGVRKEKKEISQEMHMELHEFALVFLPLFNLLLVVEEELSHVCTMIVTMFSSTLS